MATSEFTLDDDNFDDAFFEEVDKLEVLATSSTYNQQQQQQQIVASNPPSSSLYTVPPQLPQSTITDFNHTHSPPRQLSQRNPTHSTRSVSSPFSDEHLHEIEHLKCELSVVSKELLDLKQECSELKKERDKAQQLSTVHPNKKSRTCNYKDHSRNGLSPTCENASATKDNSASPSGVVKKSTGIQTDIDDESLNPSTSGSLSTYREISELLSIWHPLRGHRSRSFVAKLLEVCASDFCVLFGCLGVITSSKVDSDGLTSEQVVVKSLGSLSSEVARVSKLHSVLMKLTDETVHVNAFLEAVLDLCSLENALVVHRSLRILHIALDQFLSIERTCPIRDNVKVESCYSGSDAVHIHDSEVEKSVDWLHIYTSLCQITVKLTEEQARAEAVSILNIILRTYSFSDREMFEGSVVFEPVALLLRKEAGLFCRREALHLLYLLLNCPNILASFCSSCKEADNHTRSSKDGDRSLACQEYHVLEELAKCVVCSEYSAKELDLCRNAIIVLSFLASSGKCGLEIFLCHRLSKGANFLGLVMQVLVSELDAEALESCPVPEISKERTLLMREILILLNRLTSPSSYSPMVLQVLTSCRDMVSLAINIATRLSKESRRLPKSDSITRQMREYEVVDLACLFRRRVFSLLRDTISS